MDDLKYLRRSSVAEDYYDCAESLSSSSSSFWANNNEENLLSSTNSQNSQCNNVNISEIIELIGYFDGNNVNRNIHRWLNDFEDCSILFNWSDLQKLLIGKRLLKGVAKSFIYSENVKSWLELKTNLYNEFGSKLNLYQLQKILSKRKLLDSESFYDYFINMKEIASRGNIDSESLIHYIIDGIPDDIQIKHILYDAKTMDELKEKLKIMSKFQKNIINSCKIKNNLKHYGPEQVANNNNVDGVAASSSITCNLRCANCNQSGHEENNCQRQNQDAATSQNQRTIINNLTASQIEDMVNIIVPLLPVDFKELQTKINENKDKLQMTKFDVERLNQASRKSDDEMAKLKKKMQLLDDRVNTLVEAILRNNAASTNVNKSINPVNLKENKEMKSDVQSGPINTESSSIGGELLALIKGASSIVQGIKDLK